MRWLKCLSWHVFMGGWHHCTGRLWPCYGLCFLGSSCLDMFDFNLLQLLRYRPNFIIQLSQVLKFKFSWERGVPILVHWVPFTGSAESSRCLSSFYLISQWWYTNSNYPQMHSIVSCYLIFMLRLHSDSLDTYPRKLPEISIYAVIFSVAAWIAL